MAVSLGHSQVFMAQQALKSPQVPSFYGQIGSKGMTEVLETEVFDPQLADYFFEISLYFPFMPTRE